MKFSKIFLVALSIISIGANAQSSKDSASSGDTNQSNEAIAKELANPLASLIQVPFQYNYYQNAGPDKKDTIQAALFQPVIPLTVNKDYNYIVRPVLTLETINGSGVSNSGMGPTMIETFFSPNTNSDFLWGAGPVLQIPSSAYQYGSKQWGAGISAVAMYRPGHWTTGLLGYQTFNIGGSSLGGTANNSYLQPFVAYTAKTATTVTLMAQASFNNDAKTASVPVYLTVSQLFRLDKLPVSVSFGPAYYVASAPNGPSGWGGRASISFVLPKSMF